MYFFRSDMSRVFLSLNQGWMFFRDTYGLELAKEKISTAARAYRKLLRPSVQFG
jgi:5-methylcytosine-specific restriction protein A